MWLTDVAKAVVPVALIGGVAAYWVATVRRAAHHERASHREHARAQRAHYAAVGAAEDDPAFAPEAIEAVVASIVALAGAVWSGAKSREHLARPDDQIVTAWARSWQSRLGQGLSAADNPSVDVLSVVNRRNEDEDRVVLRMRLHIRCAQPAWGQHRAHCDERWTFGRRDTDWILLSVSGDPLAGPVLNAPFVTDPSADTVRLTEESLAELSMAGGANHAIDLSELVSPEEAPSLALGDLSVVDPHFHSVTARRRLGPSCRDLGNRSDRFGVSTRRARQCRGARCAVATRPRCPDLRAWRSTQVLGCEQAPSRSHAAGRRGGAARRGGSLRGALPDGLARRERHRITPHNPDLDTRAHGLNQGPVASSRLERSCRRDRRLALSVSLGDSGSRLAEPLPERPVTCG